MNVPKLNMQAFIKTERLRSRITPYNVSNTIDYGNTNPCKLI